MMGEWISVKDRLPEKPGYYITYCPGDDGAGWVIPLKWCDKKKDFLEPTIWGYILFFEVITHWMSLPEPPILEEK